MSKYIDAEILYRKVDELMAHYATAEKETEDDVELSIFYQGKRKMCSEIIDHITSLQQEQPIEGKQIVIITETDGDANIYWDCRSLDDVKALLASAQSFITDKQVEGLRGIGSGPDYNTTEGRFRNAHKFQQEQPEVNLEQFDKDVTKIWGRCAAEPNDSIACLHIETFNEVARHFYKLGLKAK